MSKRLINGSGRQLLARQISEKNRQLILAHPRGWKARLYCSLKFGNALAERKGA